MKPSDISALIQDRYADQLSALISTGSTAFHVSLLDIFDSDPIFAQSLLVDPSLEKVLLDGLSLAVSSSALYNSSAKMPALSIKLHSLPLCLHMPHMPQVPFCRPHSLVQFNGVVVRTGAVRMRERSRPFKCASCSFTRLQPCDEHQFGVCPRPTTPCDHIKEDGSRCGGVFKPIADLDGVASDNCEDTQEIRVQELKTDRPGAVPKSITVLLRGDLVERGKAGEQIIVTGRLIVRWRPLQANKKIVTENAVLATSIAPLTLIVPSAAKFTADIGRIVRLFCPEIKGMYPVKLATIMTVIGGSSNTGSHNGDDSGGGTRKNGHLLLVGDPGTAKSHLLRSAYKLLPKRSVFVSGPSSTSAGLTVTAVKGNTGWTLEAGALVLADGGVCCIDEFGGIGKADRTALHEAMEQQSVSVAKAGMVCRLPTRCSVLAACNTRDKGLADSATNDEITATVAIASPLLSRFDLIFVLLDRSGEKRDEEMADHLLLRDSVPAPSSISPFIMSVRDRRVTMSGTARELLARYYQKQRQQDLRDAARTTIRLLESLVRLAEAHAKMRMVDEVEEEDAAVAVSLMDLSLTRRRSTCSEEGDPLYGDRLDILRFNANDISKL